MTQLVRIRSFSRYATMLAAVLLPALGAVTTGAGAAELRSDAIALSPDATSAAVDFTVQFPSRVRAEVTLDAASQQFMLFVKPASMSGSHISTMNGTGRGVVETQITAQDLQRHGRRWVAVVALQGQINPQLPLVTGRVVVSDGAGGVTSAPPPPPPPPPPAPMANVPPPPPVAGGTVPLRPGGLVALPPRSTVVAPPPPPPPPRPAAQAARSGRYRVTLNGISVYRETWDTALQTDGKGDEIFVIADAQEMNRQGSLAPIRRKTATYGDMNGFPQRIKAGSRSDRGGIKTGDQIPYAQPWARRTGIAIDRLPLLLWEGTLTDGQNTVLIAPTVWEEDKGDWVSGAYSSVTRSAGDLLKTMDSVRRQMPHEQFFDSVNQAALSNAPLAAVTDVINTVSRSTANAVASVAQWTGKQVSWLVGVSADRPIGQMLVNDQYVFVPQVLTLNYQTAERLLNQPPPVVQAGPKPPGVIEIRYRDDDRLAGDYALWLQVERIP